MLAATSADAFSSISLFRMPHVLNPKPDTNRLPGWLGVVRACSSVRVGTESA